MFGLGLTESAIVMGLAYFAFRRYIIRRYPGFHRIFDLVLVLTVLFMVIFGVITQLRGDGL